MSRSEYYRRMQQLAQDVRARFGLATPRVLRSDMRRIYRAEGIRIDLWPHRFRDLRGAYFDDDLGPTVMLAAHLPADPMVFTMSHELKHHLVDRGQKIALCDRSNAAEVIEIGAEVFAAELIFPEEDFRNHLETAGCAKGGCTPEMLVRLKHETKTTLSYAGLTKRAIWLGFAAANAFDGIKWRALESQLYGPPRFRRRRWR